MDNKPAEGARIHFRRIAPSGQVFLIVPHETRHAVVFVNEDSANAIRVGASGTVSTQGTLIPASQSLSDNYSHDSWWGYAASSSGVVSGFIVA